MEKLFNQYGIMDNSLRRSTLLFATASSLIILVCSLGIKGVWTIYDLATPLWLCWCGVIIRGNKDILGWVKVLCFAIGIAIILFLPHIIHTGTPFFELGYIPIGVALSNDEKNKGQRLFEIIALCIVFGFIFATSNLLEHRSIIVGSEVNNPFLPFLVKCTTAIKIISLLCLVYYCYQFLMHEKIQKVQFNKTWHFIFLAICLAAFVICSVNLFLLPRHYVWTFFVCPLTACLIFWCVSKILKNNAI